jgi:hypothetical protein
LGIEYLVLGIEVWVANIVLTVQGSGFKTNGLGFRVQGSGFRTDGLGFRVQGSGLRVVPELRFRTEL